MTLLLAVTVGSLALAMTLSVVAWRFAREERDRSDARVAALADEIHAIAPAAVQGGRRTEPARLKVVAAPPSANLFAASSASSSSRSTIAVGVGLLLFATAAALIVVLGGGRGTPAERSGSLQAGGDARLTPGAAAPLELVALGQDRDGDRLTVRGVVRNPAGATRVDGLTAVVFMFDGVGGFLGSGRASIDSPSLRPGGDSPFVVNVPGAANVARYRVSFRTETGIVSHVDKRTRP
jgi:hypothetical protein